MRLAFLLKIAALILWRSWRTTLVLSFMVVASVAALVFLSALAVGTNDAMVRNSTGLFSGHIAGSELREADAALLWVSGVKQVLLRHHLPVLLTNGGNLEPVVLLGVNPEQEKEATAFWKKTVKGRYPLAGEQTIFLGQEMAKRLDLDIGSQVNLINRQGKPLKALTVVGIYKTGITHLDQGVAFCPQQALPAGETSLSVAVFLQPDASMQEIKARYRQQLPAASFQDWAEFMPDLKQLIDLNNFCMAIVIVLVFAIVSVGISCSFLIFSLKNLREHGIMKAMGFQGKDTAWLVVSQIGLLTFSAALVGTLAGMLLVALFAHNGIDFSAYTSHNPYFAVSGVLTPRLTVPALLAPPLFAVLFGLLAAIWPIVFILRKNPVEILRSV